MQEPLWSVFIPLPETDARRLPKQCVLAGALELWSRQPRIQISAPRFLWRPLGQLLSFSDPPLPHLKRCSWNYRNIKVSITLSVLCMLILSFCG